MKKKFLINDNEVEIDLIKMDDHEVTFNLKGIDYHFSLKGLLENKMILAKGSKNFPVIFHEGLTLINQQEILVENLNKQKMKKKNTDEGHMLSPMPGKIIKINVKVGDSVKKGDSLIIMEAMKMEHTIRATSDAKVEKIHYEQGDLVEGDVELVELSKGKSSV